MPDCVIHRVDIESAKTRQALQVLLYKRCGLSLEEADSAAIHLRAAADSDPDWVLWKVVVSEAGVSHLEWLS